MKSDYAASSPKSWATRNIWTDERGPLVGDSADCSWVSCADNAQGSTVGIALENCSGEPNPALTYTYPPVAADIL